MTIKPNNKPQSPAYPTLLAAVTIAGVSLASTACQQQQEPPILGGVPVSPPQITVGK